MMFAGILIGYFFIVSIVAFALMGIDKKKAKKKEYRIPEKVLFMSALFGGGLGATLGMYAFRHKTKHWYFVIGMPAILIVQIAFVVLSVVFLP